MKNEHKQYKFMSNEMVEEQKNYKFILLKLYLLCLLLFFREYFNKRASILCCTCSHILVAGIKTIIFDTDIFSFAVN